MAIQPHSRLGRRAGIGWDWRAIGNATQSLATDKVDVAPVIAAVVKDLDSLDPAFFAPIEEVDNVKFSVLSVSP